MQTKDLTKRILLPVDTKISSYVNTHIYKNGKKIIVMSMGKANIGHRQNNYKSVAPIENITILNIRKHYL